MKKISWDYMKIKGYEIWFSIIPCNIIAYCRDENGMKSDLMLFETLKEMENYFEKLLGKKNDSNKQ